MDRWKAVCVICLDEWMDVYRRLDGRQIGRWIDRKIYDDIWMIDMQKENRIERQVGRQIERQLDRLTKVASHLLNKWQAEVTDTQAYK